VKNLAAFAKGLAKYSIHRPPPTTLSMIATELENDLTKMRYRFVRAITKVCGIIRK